MKTIHYDLYQRDKDNRWHRIYSNQSLAMAKANLSVELSDPNEKDRWMVKKVTTIVEEMEVDLIS